MLRLTLPQSALRSLGYGNIAVLPRRLAALSLTAANNIPAAPPTSWRAFFQTSAQRAKKSKGPKKAAGRAAQAAQAAEEEDEDEDEDENGRTKSTTRSNAPEKSGFDRDAAFDLADVEDKYAAIDERFAKHLQDFKAGRFNPERLGQLPVQPKRSSPATFPLSDLASIVHRGGRNVSIIVSDPDYIKPVMSAIQSSAAYNQQPQQDPNNDMELVLRIEAENPEEQTKKLRAECNDWKDAVRNVMSKRKIKHAKWMKAKDITKDDFNLLEKSVKALQDKKLEAIDKTEKQYQTELNNKAKRL